MKWSTYTNKTLAIFPPTEEMMKAAKELKEAIKAYHDTERICCQDEVVELVKRAQVIADWFSDEVDKP